MQRPNFMYIPFFANHHIHRSEFSIFFTQMTFSTIFSQFHCPVLAYWRTERELMWVGYIVSKMEFMLNIHLNISQRWTARYLFSAAIFFQLIVRLAMQSSTHLYINTLLYCSTIQLKQQNVLKHIHIDILSRLVSGYDSMLNTSQSVSLIFRLLEFFLLLQANG